MEYKNNRNPFTSKGVICRRDYLISNLFIYIVVGIPVSMALLVIANSTGLPAALVPIGYAFVVLSLYFINDLKRIRDILGNNELAVPIALGIQVTVLLPLFAALFDMGSLSTILGYAVHVIHLVMLGLPGKITSGSADIKEKDNEQDKNAA